MTGMAAVKRPETGIVAWISARKKEGPPMVALSFPIPSRGLVAVSATAATAVATATTTAVTTATTTAARFAGLGFIDL